MKTFVINMTSSKDRRDFQIGQAKRLGLDIEIFTAITPADLTEAEYLGLYQTWERVMSEGEISCFLSHRKLWQYAVDHAEPVLILEDDAMLSEQTAEVLARLEGETEFDRVNLEARIKRKNVAGKGRDLGDHCLLPMFLDRSGAAGYIVWPSGAQKLLDHYEGRAAIADKAVRLYGLKSFQIEPAVVVPLDFGSYFDIETPIASASTINPERVAVPYSSFWKHCHCKARRVLDQVCVARQQLLTVIKGGKKRLIRVEASHFRF